MPVLRNISNLYQCRAEGAQADVQPISKAALVWKQSKLVWVGHEKDLPKEFNSEDSLDAQGAMVIPGLIDCHNHLAFSGWRANEFEERIKGKSYLEIAKAGGGILSTVEKTRQESAQNLLTRCEHFIGEIIKLGVTSIEVKSGYGLSVEDELKLLRVYKELQSKCAITLIPTYLGAHTLPKEYSGNTREYIEDVIAPTLAIIQSEKLASFCDVFVEESAFSISDARIIFEMAKRHGLRPKLHADQLSNGGGAELAAEVGAISADHLECISEQGIKALAKANVVAVMLPIASLYTFKPALDARRLVACGVKVAVATDFNPGSAPCFNLPLALMLSCTLNRLTPPEALKGATIYAATALGNEKDYGSLEPGKFADFALMDSSDVSNWLYHFRSNACRAVYKAGKKLFN